MNEIRYHPIGVIHSPFNTPVGIPIQPSGAKDIKGSVEVFNEYARGLKDLDGFSHVILLYHFHLCKSWRSIVTPFMDKREHGIFATRAPARPNSIGLSVVRLDGIQGNLLSIRDIDVVDGTPLLDIKPYVPKFQVVDEVRIGWLETNVRKLKKAQDDGRFL